MSAAVMRQPLWAAAEAARATGGWAQGDWTASGVSIDSRTLAPGELFVALEGPRFDGHGFAAQALGAGAAAAMLARRPAAVAADAPLLLVDDTLAGLWALGAAGRRRSAARIVAVTGSVGKTGIKTALAVCLGALGETTASAGSLNNHWGVPLSLARMPPEAAYGVFELGMNHSGEIAPLARLVRPEVAVVSNVEPVHTAFFGSVDEIAEAKAEIFEGVEPDGAAVVNRDSPHYALLAARAEAAGIGRVLGFGRHPEADVRLLDCSLHETCSAVSAGVRGHTVDYGLPLPGEHWVTNSLAVLAAVEALGADVAAAAGRLARLRPLQGRGERRRVAVPGGSFELIDDSYNANPASVRAALSVLARTRPARGGRRVAILGDMLELGERGGAEHAGLAEPLRTARVDLVFTCGPQMAALDAALPAAMRGGHAEDADALAATVSTAVRPGDAVLVKGSRGIRMGRVVQALAALDASLPHAADGR